MWFSSASAFGALTISLLAHSVASSPVQHQLPLGVNEVLSPSQERTGSYPEPRKLRGRFLHISGRTSSLAGADFELTFAADIHPDPFYVAGADPEQRCHHGKGNAGLLGAATSDCDTPFSLVNETFRWIEANLKDVSPLQNPKARYRVLTLAQSQEIDFVIWTGDSARHDNDVNFPRSDSQIYMLNRRIADGMMGVFGKPDNLGDDDPTNDVVVPIVPTLGNNDIFPHNIMAAGPNKITREFSDIWRNFIPQDQYHVFDKGAYFWTQVVPGTNGKKGLAGRGGLSVISLNTIYFFGSNAAVDGCDIKGEAGYEQMEWLKVQLALMREIGMKAILIGHVPPAWTSTKQSWDETCWKKYVLWSKQYRDVIVGSIYGHMNLDHFMVHDSDELKPPHDDDKRKKKKKKPKNPMTPDGFDTTEFDEENPIFSVQNAESYLNSLREAFSYLPSPVGQKLGDSDSVGESNGGGYSSKIGGKWGERYVLSIVGPSVVPNYFPTLRVIEYNITGLSSDAETSAPNAEHECDSQRLRASEIDTQDPSVPAPPSKTAPPGPAYSMQPYTFLGYTQYYANLTRINEHKKSIEGGHLELRDVEDGGFRYEVEYDTRTDKIYKLKDMTVKSYLKLAMEIVDATRRGNKKRKTAGDVTEGLDDCVDDDDEWDDISVEEAEVEDGSDDVQTGRGRVPRKRHHHMKDRIWQAFVRRAFVGTIEDDKTI